MTRTELFAGTGHMTRRELASWWTTRRWISRTVLWTLILGGIAAAMLWVLPNVLAEAGAPATDVRQTALQLPELVAVIVAIGVVLLTQGVIIDERDHGVLAWLLSKPLDRTGLIVAKFVGNGFWIAVGVVVVPWAAVHVVLSLADGALWDVRRSATTAGLLVLVAWFHFAFVLMLSVMLGGRAAVLAIPIVAVVSADLVVAASPALFHLSPWSLGAVASVVLVDGGLVSVWPVVWTPIWTLGLIALAAWRLRRAEL